MIIFNALLAATTNPFGTIDAPVSGLSGTPEQDLGALISVGIQAFIVVCALAALVYMLWGALDWITSGGEKDKIAKAQQKITNAVIGIIAVIAVFAIFAVVTGRVLNIVDTSGGTMKFKLPQFTP